MVDCDWPLEYLEYMAQEGKGTDKISLDLFIFFLVDQLFRLLRLVELCHVRPKEHSESG